MLEKQVLREVFYQFAVFDDTEVNKIIDKFNVEYYQPKSILINEGDINDKLYLIEYGVLREFSFKNAEQDREETNTHWLMSDGHFLYLAESYLLNSPSKISLETLEKTKLLSIKKEHLDALFVDIPSLNLVGRILTEQYLLKYESFINMLRLPPEERFDWFDDYHKDLINRVPLKYVASYLNMTPETLSRIRAKRAKKHK